MKMSKKDRRKQILPLLRYIAILQHVEKYLTLLMEELRKD